MRCRRDSEVEFADSALAESSGVSAAGSPGPYQSPLKGPASCDDVML